MVVSNTPAAMNEITTPGSGFQSVDSPRTSALSTMICAALAPGAAIVILKLAGKETDSLAELRSIIEQQGVGATVPVEVSRNGEQISIQTQFSEVPNE